MKDLLLSAMPGLLAAILCEGLGTGVLKLLKTEKRGFAAPAGAAVLFTVLEVFYMPCTVFHAPVLYACIITIIALAAAAAVTIWQWKDTLHTFWQRDTIAILASALLFVILIAKAANLDAAISALKSIHANSFSARYYDSLYPLQGYRVLQAVLLRCMEPAENIMFSGVFYHLIFAAVCLNIMRTFRLKNPWFSFTLVVYALFYSAFGGWQLAMAGSGANWRMVFIALLLWNLYCWIKDGNEQEKYISMFYMAGGMFVSPGFGVISFQVLYCLAAWLFKQHKIRSLFDITTLIVPHIIYACFQLCSVHPFAGFGLIILCMLFLRLRYQKKLRRLLWRAEDWMFDHGSLILYVIVPVSLMALNLFLTIFFPSIPVSLASYKQFLREEPVRSYLFLDHRITTYVLDVFRWGGLLLFLLHAKTQPHQQLRSMMLLMLIIFLNPLTMGVIARLVGTDVYGDSFEILFNPFTDLIFFIAIYHTFEWQPLGQWILELCLIASVLIGHGASWLDHPQGLYTDYIKDDVKIIVHDSHVHN